MEIPFEEAVKHIGHNLRVIRQDGKLTLGCNDCCLDIATEEERFINAGKIVLCPKFGCAYIEDPASGTVLTTPMNENGTISILNADWGEVDFSRISREEGDEIRKFLRPLLFAMKSIGTGVLDEMCTDDFPYTYNSAEDRMYINIDTEVWYTVFHRNGKFYLMRGSAYAMMGEDIKNLIIDRVKDRVAFEVSNLRPVITVQISQMLHGELMSMTRDVLKSDEMQEAIKGIALGVGAGFVKKQVERITETLYAELREGKDA